MNIDELRRIDARHRKDKSTLFRISTPDNKASVEQLTEVERALGVRLPVTYRDFLSEFGGGTFGLCTVFSADPASEWYLPRKHREALRYLPGGLLAFSDDFSGGYYVFQVANACAQEKVVYWNTDGGLVPTMFSNVLEFVARYAYRATVARSAQTALKPS